MSTEKKLEATLVADQTEAVLGGESDGNLEAALQAYLEQEAACMELEAKLDAAKRAENVAKQALIEKMLEQGTDSFKALGFSVSRSEFIRPSVLSADREKQMDWLREIGAGSLITETVNAASFGALAREWLKDNGELPEFVKVYREQRLSKRAV